MLHGAGGPVDVERLVLALVGPVAELEAALALLHGHLARLLILHLI